MDDWLRPDKDDDVPSDSTTTIPRPGRYGPSAKALVALAVAIVSMQIFVQVFATSGAGAVELCLRPNGEFGSCPIVPPSRSGSATTVPERLPQRPTAHLGSNGIDPVPVLSAVGWAFVGLAVVALAATLSRDRLVVRTARTKSARNRNFGRSLPVDRR